MDEEQWFSFDHVPASKLREIALKVMYDAEASRTLFAETEGSRSARLACQFAEEMEFLYEREQIMSWSVIADLLMQFLSECGQNREQRARAIRQPRRVWLGVTRALRQNGSRGRELRSQRDDILHEYASASEIELDAVVDLCDDLEALTAED